MRELFISSGHSNTKGKDRGAVSYDGSNVEGVLSVELRNLITKNYKGKFTTDTDGNILSESLVYFKNKTKSNSIVMDIHFNAGPPSATGVEVLIPADYTKFELNLAKAIADAISTTLEIPLRKSKLGVDGVKTELDSHHGRLGWMRLTGENILPEVCFISNPNEMIKFHNKKDELGKIISDILFNFANYLIANSVIVENKYVVIKGDSISKISGKVGIGIDELLSMNKLKRNSIITIGQVLKI